MFDSSVAWKTLTDALLPWRLLPIVLKTESEKAKTTKAIYCLALLALLFAVLAALTNAASAVPFAGLLRNCFLGCAAYAASLVLLAFAVLNAQCLDR